MIPSSPATPDDCADDHKSSKDEDPTFWQRFVAWWRQHWQFVVCAALVAAGAAGALIYIGRRQMIKLEFELDNKKPLKAKVKNVNRIQPVI